jgi:hypothetical protein
MLDVKGEMDSCDFAGTGVDIDLGDAVGEEKLPQSGRASRWERGVASRLFFYKFTGIAPAGTVPERFRGGKDNLSETDPDTFFLTALRSMRMLPSFDGSIFWNQKLDGQRWRHRWRKPGKTPNP